MSEDCVDCEQDGVCAWAGCGFDADWALRDVVVRRSGVLIDVGDIQLCGGHYRRVTRLGRLELDWDFVSRALEAQA